MNKLNHFSLSFGASLWIFHYFFTNNVFAIFILSFFVAFLSSLPDIDIKIIKSINNYNRQTLYILYPITFILKIIFRHRTITHTIWLPTLLLLADIYMQSNFYTDSILRVLYIGIFLHLIEDSLTKSGIKPLYPLPLKFKLFDFSTNSKADITFVQLLSIMIVISFFYVVL